MLVNQGSKAESWLRWQKAHPLLMRLFLPTAILTIDFGNPALKLPERERELELQSVYLAQQTPAGLAGFGRLKTSFVVLVVHLSVRNTLSKPF